MSNIINFLITIIISILIILTITVNIYYLIINKLKNTKITYIKEYEINDIETGKKEEN